MDAMSDILLRGGKPVVPVDGEEALKDMLIIRAIYEAAKTGQKVQLKA
jgi:predicted dehydrogenase